MTELRDEVLRLRQNLEHRELSRFVEETVLPEFTDEVRDAFVREVARQFEPPPAGHLLARLHFIATATNRADMMTTYLSNLRSPDAGARRASLSGLAELGYPQAADLAVGALRDDSNEVVATAVDILGPLVPTDERLKAVLGDVLAAHQDDPDFHLTNVLLRAAGIGS